MGGVGPGLGVLRLACLTFPPPPQGLLRVQSLGVWRGLRSSAALQQIPRAKVRVGPLGPLSVAVPSLGGEQDRARGGSWAMEMLLGWLGLGSSMTFPGGALLLAGL